MEWTPLVTVGLIAALLVAVALYGRRTTSRYRGGQPERFDAAFDGREDVVFVAASRGIPTPADVITAANDRGYELAGSIPERNGATLTFRKRPPTQA